MTRTFAIASMLLLAALAPASAQESTVPCAPQQETSRCQVCGCCCAPECLKQKSMMVPMVITETRMKTCVVKNLVDREEKYTVFECVPEKRTYKTEACYLEDEVKTKTITLEECRRVELPVTMVDTIKVPVTEVHQGVRRREVCTACGKVCIEEPCNCTVTRAVDQPRVRNGIRNDVVFETTTKEIDYCVKTPKFEEKECAEETTYKLVPVEKTRTVQVCVPEIIKQPVDVKVTREVCQTIVCCPDCLCSLNDRQAHDQRMEHRHEKLEHLADKLPNPVEHGKKVGAKLWECFKPAKVAEVVKVHAKAMSPANVVDKLKH